MGGNADGASALSFAGALAGTEGSAYPPKMEDWPSVNRTAFSPGQAVNGIDKAAIEGDIKYPQVTAGDTHSGRGRAFPVAPFPPAPSTSPWG